MSITNYNIQYFKKHLTTHINKVKEFDWSGIKTTTEIKKFDLNIGMNQASIRIDDTSYDTFNQITFSGLEPKLPHFDKYSIIEQSEGVDEEFFTNSGYKVADEYTDTFNAALSSDMPMQDLCLLFMALNPSIGRTQYIKSRSTAFSPGSKIELKYITILPIFSQALYSYWNIPVIVQDSKVFKAPTYGTISGVNVIITSMDKTKKIYSTFKSTCEEKFEFNYQYVPDTMYTFNNDSLIRVNPPMYSILQDEVKMLYGNDADEMGHYWINPKDFGPIIAFPFKAKVSKYKKIFDIKDQTEGHYGVTITDGNTCHTYATKNVMLKWSNKSQDMIEIPIKELKLTTKTIIASLSTLEHFKTFIRVIKFKLMEFPWFSKIYLMVKNAKNALKQATTTIKDAIQDKTLSKITSKVKEIVYEIKEIAVAKPIKASILISLIKPTYAATDLEAVSILAKNHPYISTFIFIVLLAIFFSVLFPLLKIIKSTILSCTWVINRRRKIKIKDFEKKYDVKVEIDNTGGTIMQGKWIYAMKQGKNVIVNKQMLSRPLPVDAKSGMLFPWVFICLVTMVCGVTYNQPIGQSAVYATQNGTCEVTIISAYTQYNCNHYAELYKSIPKTIVKRGCQGGSEDICPNGHCKDPFQVTGNAISTCREYGVPIRECFVQKKCEYISCEEQYYQLYSAEKCIRKSIVVELLVNNNRETIVDNITSGFVFYNGNRIGYNINTDDSINNRYISIGGLLFTESTAELLIKQYPRVKYNNSNIQYNSVTTISGSNCHSTIPTLTNQQYYENMRVDIIGSITWELEDTQDVVNDIYYDPCKITKCFMNVTNNVNVKLYCILEQDVCQVILYVDGIYYRTINMASQYLYESVYYDTINVTICSTNCVIFNAEKYHLNDTSYITTQELTYIDTFTTLDWILFILFIIFVLILVILIIYCFYDCCCKSNKIKISGVSDAIKPHIKIITDGDYYIINPETHRGCGEFCIALYTYIKNKNPIFVDLKESFASFSQACAMNAIFYNKDKAKIKNIGIWVTEDSDTQYHAQVYVSKNLVTNILSKFDVTPEQRLSEIWYSPIQMPISLYLLSPLLYSHQLKKFYSEVYSSAMLTVNLVPFEYRDLCPWFGYDFSSDKYKPVIQDLDKFKNMEISEIYRDYGPPKFDEVHNPNIPWCVFKELYGIKSFMEEKFFIATKVYTPKELGYDPPIKYNTALKLFPRLRELNDCFLIPKLTETIEICTNQYKSFRSLKMNDFFSPTVFTVKNQEMSKIKVCFSPAISSVNTNKPLFNKLKQISLNFNPKMMNWGRPSQENCWAGPFSDFVDNKPRTLSQTRNFYLRMGINPFVYDNKTERYVGICKFPYTIFLKQNLDHLETSVIYETVFGKVLSDDSLAHVLLSIKPLVYNVSVTMPKIEIRTIDYNSRPSMINKQLCSNVRIKDQASSIYTDEKGHVLFYNAKTNFLGTINTRGDIFYYYELKIKEGDEDVYPTPISQVIDHVKPFQLSKYSKIQIAIGNKFATNQYYTITKISGTSSSDKKSDQTDLNQSGKDGEQPQNITTANSSQEALDLCDKVGEININNKDELIPQESTNVEKQVEQRGPYITQQSSEILRKNEEMKQAIENLVNQKLREDLSDNIIRILREDLTNVDKALKLIQFNDYSVEYARLVKYYEENFFIPTDVPPHLLLMLYHYTHKKLSKTIEVNTNAMNYETKLSEYDPIVNMTYLDYFHSYNLKQEKGRLIIKDKGEVFITVENFLSESSGLESKWYIDGQEPNQQNCLKNYIDNHVDFWRFTTVARRTNFKGINAFEPITHSFIKGKKQDYDDAKMLNSCYAFATHNLIKYVNSYFKDKITPAEFFDFKFLNGTQRLINEYWDNLRLSHAYESEDISLIIGEVFVTNDTIAAIVKPNSKAIGYSEKNGGHFLFVWREQGEWYYCDQFFSNKKKKTSYKKKYKWSDDLMIFATVNLKNYMDSHKKDNEWLITYEPQNVYIDNPFTSVAQCYFNEVLKPPKRCVNDGFSKMVEDMSQRGYSYSAIADWKLFNLLDYPIKIASINPVRFVTVDDITNERFIDFKLTVNRQVYDFACSNNDAILQSVVDLVTQQGLHILTSKLAYENVVRILGKFDTLCIPRIVFFRVFSDDIKNVDVKSLHRDKSDIKDDEKEKKKKSKQKIERKIEYEEESEDGDVDSSKKYINFPEYDPTKIVKHAVEGDLYVLPTLNDNAMLESVKGYLQARRCQIKDIVSDAQGHLNMHAINMYHKFKLVKAILNYINKTGWRGRIIDINDSGSDFKYLEKLPGVTLHKYSHGTKDYHQGSPNVNTYKPKHSDIVIFCDCTYYRKYYELFNTLDVEKKFVVATHFENYPGIFSEFVIDHPVGKDQNQSIHILGEGDSWTTTRARMDAIYHNVRSYELFTWGPMTMFWGEYNTGYIMQPPRYLPNHIAAVLSPSSTIKTDTSKFASEQNRSKMTSSESAYFERLLNIANSKARAQNLKTAGSVHLTGFLGYLSKQFVDPSLMAIVQSNMVTRTYETRLSKILTSLSKLNWNLSKTSFLVAMEIVKILTSPTEMDIEVATQISRTARSQATQLNGMYLKDPETKEKKSYQVVVTADMIAHYSFKYEFKNMLFFYNIDPVRISGLSEMIVCIASAIYGLKKNHMLKFPYIIKVLSSIDTLEYCGAGTTLRCKIKDFKSLKIKGMLFEEFFKDEKEDEEQEVIISQDEIIDKKEEDLIVSKTDLKPKIKTTLVQNLVTKVVSDFNQPVAISSLFTAPIGNYFKSGIQENVTYMKKITYSYNSTAAYFSSKLKTGLANHCDKIIDYLRKTGMKDEDISNFISRTGNRVTILSPFIRSGNHVYIFPKVNFVDNPAFDVLDYSTWLRVYSLIAKFSGKLIVCLGVFINNYATMNYERVNLDYIETHKKLFDSVCFNYHVATSSPNDIAHAYQQRFKSYISPDEQVVERFDKFMTKKINSMASDIVQEMEYQHITIEDYINNLKSEKKIEAQATWNSIKKNPDLKIDTILHLIPKFNEQVLADEDKIPRTIMAPSSAKKLLVGYYSYILESAMIKKCDGFMIGKTGLEMLSEFQKYMNQDYQCFSLDGKSFDGHQHVELIRAVDNKFIELLKMMEVPEWFINNVQVLANEHHRCYVTNRPMLKLNSNKRAQKIYSFIGKTPSGHAFHTTVMNTFRSICYMEYTAYQANANIKAYAAGDDTIVFVKKSDIERFRSELKNNFLSYGDIINRKIRPDFCHGLGQVLKEFNELPTPIFCSMVFNYNFVTKNFDNAIKRNLTWSQEATSLILYARYLAIVSWHLCPEIDEAFTNYFGITKEEKQKIPTDVAQRLVRELHYTPVSQGTQEFDISVLPQSDLELIHFITNYTVVRRDEFMHNNRLEYLMYELYDSIMYLDMPTKQQFRRYQENAWKKQKQYDSSNYWFIK